MNLLDWLSQKRGRQAALAGELGIRPPTVSDWAAGDKRVALDRCPAIERATQGAVTCETLRPDAAWSRIPDPSWPHPAGRPVIDVARPVVAVAQEG